MIKEKRLNKNLTLDALSRITCISKSTLSNLENGKTRNPSSVFLYRLSMVLDIDMDTMNQHKYREYYRKKELYSSSLIDKKSKL